MGRRYVSGDYMMKYYKGTWEKIAYDWFACDEKNCKVYHTVARDISLEMGEDATKEAERGYYKFLNDDGYPKVNIKVKEYKTKREWEEEMFLEKI